MEIITFGFVATFVPHPVLRIAYNMIYNSGLKLKMHAGRMTNYFINWCKDLFKIKD